MALKRIIVLMLLLSLLLSMTGCKKAETPATQPQTPTVTPSPEPAVTAQPAQLLTGVETDRKVVSLIFEGYTDAATMEAIAKVLKDRDVPSTALPRMRTRRSCRILPRRVLRSAITA